MLYSLEAVTLLIEHWGELGTAVLARPPLPCSAGAAPVHRRHRHNRRSRRVGCCAGPAAGSPHGRYLAYAKLSVSVFYSDASLSSTASPGTLCAVPTLPGLSSRVTPPRCTSKREARHVASCIVHHSVSCTSLASYDVHRDARTILHEPLLRISLTNVRRPAFRPQSRGSRATHRNAFIVMHDHI